MVSFSRGLKVFSMFLQSVVVTVKCAVSIMGVNLTECCVTNVHLMKQTADAHSSQ